MARTLVFALLLASATAAHGDTTPAYLTQFNTDRIELNTWGMLVLLAWAAANIGVGTVGNFTSTGSTRYLHQGNAAWNLVNLAIAGFSLVGLQNEDPAALSAAETIEKAHEMEWLLWLNSGLDVAYMAAGGFLWERGARKTSDRMRGYGQALILQGAFLLAFDLTLVALNIHHNRGLVPRLVASVGEDGSRVLGLALPW